VKLNYECGSHVINVNTPSQTKGIRQYSW